MPGEDDAQHWLKESREERARLARGEVTEQELLNMSGDAYARAQEIHRKWAEHLDAEIAGRKKKEDKSQPREVVIDTSSIPKTVYVINGERYMIVEVKSDRSYISGERQLNVVLQDAEVVKALYQGTPDEYPESFD